MAKSGMIYVPVKGKKKQDGRNTSWAESKKIEVLTNWLAHGNLAQAARDCGVGYETCRDWRDSDWWKERTKQIQADDGDKMDNKLSKAVDKALTALMDRIEHGDSMYDPRTGEMVRVPAKLRDLNAAFNTVVDKRQLLRKQPTKITEQTSTAAQLQNLAAQFASFVSGKKPTEVIQYEEPEAIEAVEFQKETTPAVNAGNVVQT